MIQKLWGIPVVFADEATKETVLFGSFPEPEREGMTTQEYAEQCAQYWQKLKLEHEAAKN